MYIYRNTLINKWININLIIMKIIKNRLTNKLAWLWNYEIWILLEKLIKKTGKALKCWFEGVYIYRNTLINKWININNNENHKK